MGELIQLPLSSECGCFVPRWFLAPMARQRSVSGSWWPRDLKSRKRSAIAGNGRLHERSSSSSPCGTPARPGAIADEAGQRDAGGVILRDCTSPGGLCLSRESISGLSCRPYEGPPAAVCTINCRRSAVVAVYNRTTFEYGRATERAVRCSLQNNTERKQPNSGHC